jgi:hypothetical protein
MSGPRPGDLRLRMHAVCSRRGLAPRTEKAYFGWVKRYVRFHGLRHPATLDAPENHDVAAKLFSRGRSRLWPNGR